MDVSMQRINFLRGGLRWMSGGCTLLLCLVGWSSHSLGDWRDDVEYARLVNILGASLPNGADVPISLVEAFDSSNHFYPNIGHVEFDSASDPLGDGVNFFNGSNGLGTGVSSHSNSQARIFFGNTTSVAPAANKVTIYEANNYLSNVLPNASKTVAPEAQDFRVQNFSWVGSFATPNDGTPDPTPSELNSDREALRRFDYVIDENNITAVVGLGNSSGEILPHLLSHSYNSIAVGRSDGSHSAGLTHLANYGVGRSKPDLVAPLPFTSDATSSVSSSAAFLYSADTVVGTDAAKSETIKALLMAGATKDEFPTWSQIDAGGEWHPLDDTYGAGEVNLYNSYLATLSGRFAGDTLTPTEVGRHGWDYQTIQPGTENNLLYDFVIPNGSFAAELSVVLTWNAKINSPFNTGFPIVADLNLELVDSTGTTIDFDINDTIVEGLSQSEVDNVEHLYLTNLAAGTYTLRVSSDDLASDFGLAWRTSTLFDDFSADFDEDGDIDSADFLTWQRGFGTLINATHANGDADGDGDVDSDDLAFGPAAVAARALALRGSLTVVPEPTSWLLACVGLLLALGLRLYRYPIGLSR